MSEIEAWIADLSRRSDAFRRANPLPHAWYNREGDALEVYLEEGPGIFETVDQFVTVVASRDDRTKPIGFVLKNISTNFRSSIQEIGVVRGAWFIRFLLFEAGSLAIKSLARHPGAPSGESTPRMSVEDLLPSMKRNAPVSIANPEEIEQAIAAG